MEQKRKRQALGKGLGALIPGGEGGPDSQSQPFVGVDEIFPNPTQPRRKFDKASLKDLASSIREKGVLQPVLVQKVPGGYELVAGERRLRAARLAGLEKIPVQVRKLQDVERLEMALIENIQREDLNSLEEAQAYRELQEKYGYTQEEVAKKVGKDRATVANAIRLLSLPEFVKGALVDGNISAGHARALLPLTDERAVHKMLDRILEKGLSVREVESAVSSSALRGVQTKPARKVSVEIADLEKRLARRLGTRVRVSEKKRGGRIEISYSNLEDLNGLVDILLSN